MIAPGCVALAGDPVAAMVPLCIGGFGHQMVTIIIDTLSADLFNDRALGAANGWIRSFGWAGGLLYSLAIGAVGQRAGFGLLFACLSVFDLVGLAVVASMLLPGADRRRTAPVSC